MNRLACSKKFITAFVLLTVRDDKHRTEFRLKMKSICYAFANSYDDHSVDCHVKLNRRSLSWWN